MTYILIIISLFLDGFLSIIINKNSYFIPHILLTTLFIIYPKYKKKNTLYNVVLIIVGLIYDLLYTNLLFFHAIIFYLLGQLIKYLYKNYNQSTVMSIISLIVVIISYILLTAITLSVFKTANIKISEVLVLISKSLLINVIYLMLLKPILKNKA